ncbi:WecB/TagA/CpsF family glycosyltransferase [Candidatus Solirubrobacter pratensis]|uniref:WecB/TagA/CpsF family glycosyltransferase n=1 Tax=Candidatus Solirubrobacter pratensis TaxID=1298857 RepID=UPI0004264975|nr:WecB/TagA/CpsF family glycosyltransferase [Candidatus Solirubrobacter pratensis]
MTTLPTSTRDDIEVASPATADVLGVPLAITDYERTLDWIDAAVEAGARSYICVAAVHTVMASAEDPTLRAAVLGADFTVPDGQPLVWALNLLGHRLGDRVYGPTLMDRAFARAAESGRRFYLYGGRDQAALDELKRVLSERHPGVNIVGGYAPPFRELTDAEDDAVSEDIRRSGADVVWVGIGVPKQEKWMSRMRDRLEAPVLIGVGAAFDFHAGLVPQAPRRMQELGLEWLFRLRQEPGRLWRRYARYNPRFVLGFARQYLARSGASGR